MSTASTKPVIFISYSHKDEPEHPRDGEVQWLSFVRTYLQPAVKHGVFELWVDQHMPGGADWGPEIEQKLRECDVFILLVSANSMASDYIIDKEISIIRERQAKGETVHFYPLLLMPTPKAGLEKVKDKNLRPRDAKPFSGYSTHDRAQHMTNAADEIADLVEKIFERKGVGRPAIAAMQPAYVHITGLPETAYERLVGRDAGLKRLDEAWADSKTNILSLVAEGGAGKSALVNEWLKRMQADNYRDAEAVLGWSFYNQGTKERATSADEFLDWAHAKLGITLVTTSASAKAEAIAEAMMRRRVLLLLDGVEPLQHGPGPQLGQLKDFGLRALLRRFAATPPGAEHGVLLLTSRLAVKDIARWQDGAAPVVDVDQLSDEAGAALLRDNGVWGTDKELKTATHDFGGHPLALGLLASFLKETQTGDVRRRNRIRGFFADAQNPGHDHAKRVMESYETEWLSAQPLLLAIMYMVGLFDRPASGDCLQVLQENPVISGFPELISNLNNEDWNRAITRLRDVRLLEPADALKPDSLDTHALVRDWFGDRFRQNYRGGWTAAQNRLFEHLRDTTKEGKTPTLQDLAPLQQAIAHGCSAGRHQEAWDQILHRRLVRTLPDGRTENYVRLHLGAVGSTLAAISWFFSKLYEAPVSTLSKRDHIWILGEAANCLRTLGRFGEALQALRGLLEKLQSGDDPKYFGHRNSSRLAISLAYLARTELLVGDIAAARDSASRSTKVADYSKHVFWKATCRATQAAVVHASGQHEFAEHLFAQTEKLLLGRGGGFGSPVSTYHYCEFSMGMADWRTAEDRATASLRRSSSKSNIPLDIALLTLALGRACFGFALSELGTKRLPAKRCGTTHGFQFDLDKAIAGLRSAETSEDLPRGLLARAAFRRSVGDWNGAARDLDEVEEIAEPGPMRLYLCDMALERARLAFARIEAFAPLNGFVDNSPPKPERPSEAERKHLQDEAAKQLAIAADYIEKCGYHRRDEELAELEAVLKGEKTFAELPPRV